MKMTIKDYLTITNFTDKNSLSRIKYIVIHYTAGTVDNGSAALNNAQYFYSAYRGASAHYFVDSGDTIYRVVNDNDIAWHCGTSGKYYHPYCRNSNSIGIEICSYKQNGQYLFKDKAVDKAVELTKMLMAKYGVPAENVIMHYHVTHKICAAPFMRNGVPAEGWDDFKARISGASKITETATNGIGVVKTNGSTLNLRSTHSTAGDILARIPDGTKLAIVGTVSNGWFKVRYEGTIGYVSGDYLVLSAEKLTDITGHYAEKHIRKLLDYGVVNGYEDKSYRPDNTITRAEFASLTANALEKACGYSLKTSPVFADMEGHWAKEIVAKLVACGIVNGFEDGTFKPDLKITRGQAAIIAANMLSYCGLPGKDYARPFPDTALHYADDHIQTLQHYGVVNGYEDGLFRPDEEITRGQAAMYIANCLTVLGK